ncbi:MAG: hypothetical protein HQ477_13880 [Chloroflexi bacterium]|nr:hypothetical protein [Chloroflexota bacterium]
MPDKTKFEREIDKILEKSEETSSQPTERRHPPGKHRSFEPFTSTLPKSKPPSRATSIKINPGNVIIVGLVLLAIAAFVPAAKVPTALLGVAFVVIGYMLWFRNVSQSGGGFETGQNMFGRGKIARKPEENEPQVKYWRGRRIEDEPSPSDRGKVIDFDSSKDDDKS